jgi:WD40 repeat protein/tRNA A-37 threonylcarbamoyl transferase component Bud32
VWWHASRAASLETGNKSPNEQEVDSSMGVGVRCQCFEVFRGTGMEKLAMQKTGREEAFSAPLVETVLGGRYLIKKLLGRSLFSETYLARDQQLPGQPICVVKRLQTAASPGFDQHKARQFFDTEAEVLYQLGQYCSEIPRLLAHFEQEQEFYLVQEYVLGHDLSCELVTGVPWEEAEVIDLLRSILEVLQHVHSQNVIHRDIKPRNLMRRAEDAKVVLIDFGAVKQLADAQAMGELNWEETIRGGGAAVASLPLIERTAIQQELTRQEKRVTPASSSTLSSVESPLQHPSLQHSSFQQEMSATILVGTPGFMPYEQRAGKPRFCSDLYAVGMVALQALTGIPAREFGEDPQGELCWQQMATVRPAFAKILSKLVRSHWRDRYQSVTEVLADLDRLPASTDEQTVFSQVASKGSLAISLTVSTALAVLVLATVALPQVNRWKQQSQQWTTALFSQSKLISMLTLDSQSGDVSALAVEPNGKVMISGGEALQFWDMTSGKLIMRLAEHQQPISALATSRDGKRFVSGSTDQTIKVWDVNQGKVLQSLSGHQSRVSSVQLTADGKELFSAGDRQILQWNVQSGELLQTFAELPAEIHQLALSADGKYLAAACADGRLWIWSTQSGEQVQVIEAQKPDQPLTVVAFMPEQKRVIAGGVNQLKIWDVESGKQVATFPLESKDVVAIALSQDGQHVASSHRDGAIKLWDGRKYTLIERQQLAAGTETMALIFCPDGKKLISGGKDETLAVWQVR